MATKQAGGARASAGGKKAGNQETAGTPPKRAAPAKGGTSGDTHAAPMSAKARGEAKSSATRPAAAKTMKAGTTTATAKSRQK